MCVIYDITYIHMLMCVYGLTRIAYTMATGDHTPICVYIRIYKHIRMYNITFNVLYIQLMLYYKY